jgi:hypothetical protein
MMTQEMQECLNDHALRLARTGRRAVDFQELCDEESTRLFGTIEPAERVEYLKGIRRFLREKADEDGEPLYPQVILVSERHWTSGNAETMPEDDDKARLSLPAGHYPAYGFYIAQANGDLIASHYCWQQTRMAVGLAGKAYAIEEYRGAPVANLQRLASIVETLSTELDLRSGRRKPRKVREAATA